MIESYLSDGLLRRCCAEETTGILRSMLARMRGLFFAVLKRTSGPFAKIHCCAECFQDTGLIHSARRLGRPLRRPCPRCGARQSNGLTIEDLHELVFQFFVRGTYFHGLGGYAPVLIRPGTRVEDPQLPFREET